MRDKFFVFRELYKVEFISDSIFFYMKKRYKNKLWMHVMIMKWVIAKDQEKFGRVILHHIYIFSSSFE